MFRLLRSLGRPPFGPRLVLSWAKQRGLSWIGRSKSKLPFLAELPDVFCSKLRQEYLVWLERRRVEAVGDSDPGRYLSLLLEMVGYVDMNWAATSALGIRRSMPFFNREMIEMGFECHPTELIGPGPKKILRRALHHDVPAQNLYRPDKGHRGAYTGDNPVAWKKPLPAGFQSLVRPDWFPLPPGQMKRWEAEMLSRLDGFCTSLNSWRSRREPR